MDQRKLSARQTQNGNPCFLRLPLTRCTSRPTSFRTLLCYPFSSTLNEVFYMLVFLGHETRFDQPSNFLSVMASGNIDSANWYEDQRTSAQRHYSSKCKLCKNSPFKAAGGSWQGASPWAPVNVGSTSGPWSAANPMLLCTKLNSPQNPNRIKGQSCLSLKFKSTITARGYFPLTWVLKVFIIVFSWKGRSFLRLRMNSTECGC